MAISSLDVSRNAVIAVRPQTLKQLTGKHDAKELSSILKEYNIPESLGNLTQAQAEYIESFKSLDTFRNRVLEARRAGGGQESTGILQERGLGSAAASQAKEYEQKEPIFEFYADLRRSIRQRSGQTGTDQSGIFTRESRGDSPNTLKSTLSLPKDGINEKRAKATANHSRAPGAD